MEISSKQKSIQSMVIQKTISGKLSISFLILAITLAFSVYAHKNADIYQIDPILSTSVSFDAITYLTIGTKGYYHTVSHSFFPAYPLLINATQSLLSKISVFNDDALIAVNVAINFALSTIAGLLMFKIIAQLFNNDERGLKACMAFIYSPAAIFYCILYSDSLYVFILFGGIRLIQKHYQVIGGFTILLTCFVNPNALVNLLLIVIPLYFEYKMADKTVMKIKAIFLMLLYTSVGAFIVLYNLKDEFSSADALKHLNTGILSIWKMDSLRLLAYIPSIAIYGIMIYIGVKSISCKTLKAKQNDTMQQSMQMYFTFLIHFIVCLLATLIFARPEVE